MLRNRIADSLVTLVVRDGPGETLLFAVQEALATGKLAGGLVHKYIAELPRQSINHLDQLAAVQRLGGVIGASGC